MAWVRAERSLPEGGYSHGEPRAPASAGGAAAADPAGPFLGDTLAVGDAALSLYEVTARAEYLRQSEAAALFIAAHFSRPNKIGFNTAAAPSGDQQQIEPNRDEMVQLARYANRLYHYTGDPQVQAVSAASMRYLALPAVAHKNPPAGVLLAAAEFGGEPTHITVVGGKDDPAALALFQAALRYPSAYKRIEWWDRRQGELLRHDVSYPQLPKAAAFACSGTRCSLPLFAPETLVAKVAALSKGPH